MVASKPHLFPPFRADQIGSLKRPAKLLAKRSEFDDNKCTAEELRAVEDEAITAIVEMQREVGIKAITDGEFRRYVSHPQHRPTRNCSIVTNLCLQTYVLRGCLRQPRWNEIHTRR